MRVTRILRRFPEDTIPDVPAAVRTELDAARARAPAGGLGKARLDRARIAVAVGSRGITGIDVIVRAVVRWIRDAGGSPFVVPAMGSHGGATAEGQRAVLAEYGITEAGVGVPVVSTMEVVDLGGYWLDTATAAADGIVMINRVKPHTDFHGDVESGLLKMAVIGLGKQRAAAAMHALGVEGLRTRIEPTAARLLESGRVLAGLAVVENAHDRARTIRALLPAEIPAVERVLLAQARVSMARLPVDALDVLVVDEMGKDISGVGMDTNVIGRMRIEGQPEPDTPRIRRIVVLGLTPASHGNALGMGLADFATEAFRSQVDFAATYENVLTATFLARAMLPIIAPTPADAVAWALRSLGLPPGGEGVRLARIASTLELTELWVSDPVREELRGHEGITITTETRVSAV